MTDPSPELAARIAGATELLEALQADRGLLAHIDPELRKRLLMAAGRVARPDLQAKRAYHKAGRAKERETRREHDEALLDATGIRQLRENPIFKTPRREALYGASPPPIGEVHDERTCYACRAPYTKIHHFYDQMCLACGDLNFEKRHQTADLTGRTALITGSRLKIGYQAAILMLRSGCRVLVTTRFPKDAARRYAAEPDYATWCDRLEIFGLDLRHLPSVEAFCQDVLRRYDRLDFIINNACQTVRRPPAFYAHLLDREATPAHQLPDAEAALLAKTARDTDALARIGDPGVAALSQVALLAEDEHAGDMLFPPAQLDADEQQVDLRDVNSWRLKMAEISTIEVVEVQLVNTIAPFILNARLKPLMQAVPTRDKHIVNVSAMEGQFYRTFKSDRHPHTNMAKASLNMMTRTAALDYIEDGIHMNSVDTGWVTDEDPVVHAERKKELHRFHPPLDIVDGAARIVDPILHGLNTGEHVWGQFLKDYKVCDW